MIESSNPALKKINTGVRTGTEPVMTIQGTINATFILTTVLIAYFTYANMFTPDGQLEFGILHIGSAIAALILAFVIIFKQHWARVLSPVYAVLEGITLGAISALFEVKYPGIATQAVLATFGVLLSMLFAYKSRLIRPTEKFRNGVIMATGAIFLLFMLNLVLSLFGVNVGFMHDSSPLSIGISLVIIVVASLNLILDFDFIEKAAAQGAPKYYEWYGAFGLLVTLVWLYMEFLRLFSKLKDR